MNTSADDTAWTVLPAAQRGETVLSLRDLLRAEHRKGALLPRLRQAATEAWLLDQAKAMGLRVELADLQRAADLARRRRQLLTSAQTHAWLAERRLTEDDFEAVLEQKLLLRKLRAHVVGDRVPEHFQAHHADFDRLRLRLILAGREDLAREIHVQLVEEGADFAELARKHSRHPSASNGGRTAPMYRGRLVPPLQDALPGVSAGTLVGPVPVTEGFYLVLIEEITPATLDAETTAVIAGELFQAWLRERLATATFGAPLLDLLA